MLAAPTGEAYTCTVIGPDGAVYAINNATLCSVVATPRTAPQVIYNSSIVDRWRPIGRILAMLIAVGILALALIALASKALAGRARRPRLSGFGLRKPALIPIERTN
jgi:hypothetical protein